MSFLRARITQGIWSILNTRLRFISLLSVNEVLRAGSFNSQTPILSLTNRKKRKNPTSPAKRQRSEWQYSMISLNAISLNGPTLDFHYTGSRQIRRDSEGLFRRRITILAAQFAATRLTILSVSWTVEPQLESDDTSWRRRHIRWWEKD